MNNELHSLDVEIRNAEDHLHSLEASRRQLQSLMVDEALKDREVACNCGGPEHSRKRLLFGSWDCSKSPISLCVYDLNKDPYHDECLFCGEPEERS